MSKKLKVALVNVFFAPQAIGGATRVLIDNFHTFRKRYSDSLELSLFTSDADKAEKPYELFVYIYEGVRVYRTSILFRENMDWYPKEESVADIFDRFLEFEKPDVVHFHCIQRLGATMAEMCLRRSIPYIVTLHDAWWISDYQFLVNPEGKVYPEGHPDVHEETILPSGITRRESIARKAYLSTILNRASSLLTVSERFAEIYAKNGFTDVEVIKNGISSAIEWKTKETGSIEKVVCGHIGGMSAHKGYDILVEAVISESPENLEFLVVDHSKERGYVSKEKWGETDVTFIGPVPQEKITDLYSSMDILFAPSIWPESFGLVTREAAACGCWIVAGEMGGIGEDIEDGVNGFVIEPTVEELCKTIREIDSRPQKYKEPAPHGSIRYADEQAEELVTLYKRLSSTGSG